LRPPTHYNNTAITHKRKLHSDRRRSQTSHLHGKTLSSWRPAKRFTKYRRAWADPSRLALVGGAGDEAIALGSDVLGSQRGGGLGPVTAPREPQQLWERCFRGWRCCSWKGFRIWELFWGVRMGHGGRGGGIVMASGAYEVARVDRGTALACLRDGFSHGLGSEAHSRGSRNGIQRIIEASRATISRHLRSRLQHGTSDPSNITKTSITRKSKSQTS
jgi:hypothetical protein